MAFILIDISVNGFLQLVSISCQINPPFDWLVFQSNPSLLSAPILFNYFRLISDFADHFSTELSSDQCFWRLTLINFSSTIKKNFVFTFRILKKFIFYFFFFFGVHAWLQTQRRLDTSTTMHDLPQTLSLSLIMCVTLMIIRAGIALWNVHFLHHLMHSCPDSPHSVSCSPVGQHLVPVINHLYQRRRCGRYTASYHQRISLGGL